MLQIEFTAQELGVYGRKLGPETPIIQIPDETRKHFD